MKNSFLQHVSNFYSSSGNEIEQKNNSGRKKVTQKIIWQKLDRLPAQYNRADIKSILNMLILSIIWISGFYNFYLKQLLSRNQLV
jgi:hypothetical protein